ncbi:MAG: transcriptional regulator Brz [Haloferacaceae archaeon]
MKTVPISELPCPQCGSDVKVGLPKGSTVKSITVRERPESDEQRWKTREFTCRNGHEFFVAFEW